MEPAEVVEGEIDVLGVSPGRQRDRRAPPYVLAVAELARRHASVRYVWRTGTSRPAWWARSPACPGVAAATTRHAREFVARIADAAPRTRPRLEAV